MVVLEGEPNKDSAARLSKLTVYVNVFAPDNCNAQSGGASAISAGGSFRINGLRPGKAIIRLVSREGPSMRVLQVLRIEREGVRQNREIEIQAGENLNGISVVVAYGMSVIRGQVKLEGGTLPPGITDVRGHYS